MSSLRDQQKEVVRLLALQHDLKTTSELSGIPYDLVRQWESRRKRKNGLSQPVTMPVSAVADKLETELQEHESETRMSLARASRRMAKDCEGLPVRHAEKAYTVAKTAAIIHRWDAKTTQSNVMVNIALLGVDPNEVRCDAAADTIDLAKDSGTDET